MLKITPRKMIKCCIYMADDPYYQLIITLENISLLHCSKHYIHVHFQICDSFKNYYRYMITHKD